MSIYVFAGMEQAPVGGFNPMMIIMLVGMLGLMFFMQRRARKQAAERDTFRSALGIGQRVMTQGGLVGTIVAINDATDTVIIDSAGSRCEYMRAGIAKTLDDAAAVPVAVPVAGAGEDGAITTPQYGANPPAPAAGGFLANALGNLANAQSTGPQVSDDDLAELESISREYHEARGPMVIEEITEEGN